MDLNIHIDMQKYKPQKSDLKLLKDGSVILALAVIIGTLYFAVRALIS